jgi:hypothetical protein
MRVFKLRAFARFQRREGLSDEALCRAVADAEAGLIDADLGGGLIKQRVARKGRGKSGGYRTLLAYRSEDRAVFLFGFAKSDRDNIDNAELRRWRGRGSALLALDDDGIDELMADDELAEIDCDDEA